MDNQSFIEFKNMLKTFYDEHKQNKMFLLVEITNESTINSLFDDNLKNLYTKATFINGINTQLSIPYKLYIISCDNLKGEEDQINYLKSSDYSKMKTINNYLKNPNNYLNVTYSIILK